MDIIEVDSLGDLPAAARLIIDRSGSQGVVALRGPMGAGKTTLVREICSALGVADKVASPTFALVNHYCTAEGKPVYHFDFYRIDDIREAFDLGYEEYFYSGDLCLVEWPEKVEEILPEEYLAVKIEITGNHSRRITVG